MKIGETYLRIAPKGDKTIITIATQDEKEYQEALEKEGFEFQLQQVSSPNVCTSCEG